MSPTRPTRRLATLAAALLLPLALVACGGDGDESAQVVDRGSEETTTTAADDDADESTTTTGGDDGSTTTTDGADDTTTTTEGGEEPSSDLAAALLTADDLPAGFAQDGEDDTTIDMGDEAGLCQGETTPPAPPVEQITRSFESGDREAYVGSFIGRFEGDEAGALLQWFSDETERCSTIDDPDEGTYTIEAVPGVGDEAVLLVASGAGGSTDVAVARVGDLVVGVSSFASPGAGVDVASLLALSAGRL